MNNGSRRPVAERVLRHTVIDTETGCWRWPGTKTKGYGQVRSGRRRSPMLYVHRVVYEAAVGPILGELDHVWEAGCRYKDCHNPDHLEDVTHEENVRRFYAR